MKKSDIKKSDIKTSHKKRLPVGQPFFMIFQKQLFLQ